MLRRVRAARALAMLQVGKQQDRRRGDDDGEAERDSAEGDWARNGAYRRRAGRRCQGLPRVIYVVQMEKTSSAKRKANQ